MTLNKLKQRSKPKTELTQKKPKKSAKTKI